MMTSSGNHISLPAPFSNGDPVEWFRRFKICCRANDWGVEIKAKKLPTLLEREAIAVWFELTSEEQDTYDTTKERITEQMVPARFVSLADLYKRSLLPGEPLSVFAHEFKRLLEQALQTADAGTSKQLLLHQFINGLPSSISTQQRTGGQIDNNLKTAMQWAKILMTLKKKPEGVAAIETAEVTVFKDHISALTEQAAALTAKQRPDHPGMQCATDVVNQVICKDMVHWRGNAMLVDNLDT